MHKILSDNIWRYTLFVIILTIAVEGIWFFVIIPDYEKLKTDYTSYIEHEGEDQIAQDAFGEMSPSFRLQESLTQEVIATDGDIITIKSTVNGLRTDTGEIIFKSEKNYHVNQITRMHSNMDNKYFAFPQDVKKQDYDFFHPLIFNDAKLVFENVEKINGLEVYVFTAKTTSNDISFAFPQFAPNIVLSDTFSRLWVEPITGSVIKYEKEWEDYILIDEVQKNNIQKGWKKTTDFTEAILVEYTMAKIENLRFYKILMPIFLGTLFLGVGSVFILLNNYVSTQKKIEQKNKLETLGNLTARISHDIRNPLTIIKSTTEIIKLKENLSPKLREYLDSIDKAVSRISYQVDNVLDFVKPHKLDIKQVSVKSLVESSIKSAHVPKNIKIIVHVKDVRILADFNQLETALINIITNSVQSMSKTGEITITVREHHNQIHIQIKDSGPGIPEDIIEKIFDPLFTTKLEGTGLGLFSCKMIVENHGGTISVTNNPTTFTIVMPKGPLNRD